MKSFRVRRPLARAASCALCVVSCVLGSSGAAAEPTAEDRAAAEVLFREGLSLVEAGSIADGCRKFEASQTIDPQLGTLLYLATCHEQEGKTATSFAEFTEAKAQAERASKPERVAQAEAGIARVEPKLSRLSVVAEGAPPGLVVRVNGRPLKLLGEALPYDAGVLVIEAEAPGHQPSSAKFELAPGPVSERFSLPPLLPAPSDPRDGGGSSLPWIVGGAGVGLTVVGLAFGGVALATSSAAKDECQGALCTQEGLDGHAAANGWAWGSNIAIGLGLVGVGVGTYLLLTDDGGAPPPVEAGAIVLPDGSFAVGVGGVW